MIIPAITVITIASCVQIQNGDTLLTEEDFGRLVERRVQ